MFLERQSWEDLRPSAVAIVAFGPICQIEIKAAGAFGPAPTVEKPYVGPEALAAGGATKRVNTNIIAAISLALARRERRTVDEPHLGQLRAASLSLIVFTLALYYLHCAHKANISFLRECSKTYADR